METIGKIAFNDDGTKTLTIAELQEFECDCGSDKAKILKLDKENNKGLIKCKKCGIKKWIDAEK